MKKIKLLLAAMAAMVTMGANAQTAADFAGGKYIFQNIGSGRYLGPSNSWGTQASLIEFSHFNTLAKLSDGVYSIESQVTNGGTNYYFTGSYMDGAAANVTINDLGNGIYTMSNGTTYYGYNGSSYVLASDLTDPTDANAQWKIIAYDEAYNGASEENPVDVTYMILCPNFDRNHRSAGAWTMVANNQNLSGGTNENRCAESWRAAFTLSQTVEVPNGFYRLRAQAALTDYSGTGENFPVVYLNEATVPFLLMQNGESSMSAMSDQFAAGNYFTSYTDVVTVTSGKLTLGVKGTRTDTWCIWDNFQLLYLGPLTDLSAYAQALADAVAAAQVVEGTVPTAAYNAIASVITANNQEYSTADEYTTAIENINAAVNTYASSSIVSAYANYTTIKAIVEGLDDDATVFTGDATVDVSSAATAAEAATTVNAINAAIDQLRTAAAEFFSSVTLNEGKRFDITNIYLINPDFEVPTANGQMPTGWTITITGQNCGQQNRTDTNPESGLAITNFIEAWHPSQLGSGVIAQTVNSLPEGTYVLECDASICHDPAGADDITGASLFIQSSLKTERQAISNVRLYINHYSLSFSHGGVGSVTFGLEADNTNANWLSADNFKVYYAGGVDLSVYAEALADAVTEFEALEATSAAANYAIYKAIVDANNKTWGNSAEYQAAIDAIHAAKASLQEINAVEAAYNTALAAAKTTVAKEDKMAASLRTALNTTIATYEGIVDVTSKDDLEAATTALNAATAKAETSIASYAIIAAGIIPDNSIEGWVCENTQTFHVNTWSTESGPNLEGATRESYDPANMVVPFIENWVARGEYLGEGKIYYRLEGLEPGERFYASALVRSYNEASADAPNGPNFYINDSETDLTADGITFTYNGMSGIYATLATMATIGDDGVFELGVKIDADRNYNWVAFKNVRILNYDFNTTTIDETVAYTPEVKAGNVKLNRTIKEGYNTVVLPFGMTQEEVEAKFGAEAKVYVVSNYDSEKANISFAETSGITANQPCILKATVAGTSYDLEDRIMTNEEPVFAATNVSMIGSYAASTTIAKDANNYIISNDNLYLVDSDNVSMKNTRAYIQLAEPSAVKVLTMSFDGETTGINEINGMAIENAAIYNLAGQRVIKAQKGIFIVNGKKVVK